MKILVREDALVVAIKLPDGSLQLQPIEVLEEVLKEAAALGLYTPRAAVLQRKVVH